MHLDIRMATQNVSRKVRLASYRGGLVPNLIKFSEYWVLQKKDESSASMYGVTLKVWRARSSVTHVTKNVNAKVFGVLL